MNTYSERLNEALVLRGLNQSELARLIDVKPQAIQYLCASKVQKSRFTLEIAQALGINYEWLATGKEPMLLEDLPEAYLSGKALIKIINWNALYQYIRNDHEISELVSSESLIVEDSKKDCIGLYLPDHSMLPKFEPGCLMIIKPDSDIKKLNEKYVLAYINKDNVFVFRQLKLKQNKHILSPLNLNLFKEVELDKNDKIIGVLVESRTDFM